MGWPVRDRALPKGRGSGQRLGASPSGPVAESQVCGQDPAGGRELRDGSEVG